MSGEHWDLDAPYVELASPSTTPADDAPTLRPGRRSRRAQWREAPPLRLASYMGARTPVSVTLTPRIGSDLYIEVSDHRGRFWVRHDGSVWDLVQKLQQGGYLCAPPASTTRKPRRGRER